MPLKHGTPEEAEREPRISHDNELDEYLRQCVRINPEDIQEEFVRIPGDLAYWNAKYAAAMRKHLHAKIDEKVLEAQLQPVVRTMLINAGSKLTESLVEAAIQSDPSLIEAKRRTVDAEVEKNECFGYLDSIRSKKDMLVSLGAMIRQEMQGDPLIREQVQARRVMGGD